MPARSRVRQLPLEIRQELDRRLIAGGFSGYRELATWLQSQGHKIGRMAVHRHGEALERRIEKIRLATEHAEALVEASGDESGTLADASLRMIQTRFFELLVRAESGAEGSLKELSAAARALAEAARAGQSIRAERRKALKEAADEAVRAAKRHSEAAGERLSQDTLDAIRRDVYGIHDA